MDVLFGSINVRELLSTPDLDDASPLSVPDLRLLIDRLQIRSLRIKDRVRDYVLSHRDDFAEIFSRCADVASKTETLSSNLCQALQLLSDDPVDAEIKDLAVAITKTRKDLEERKEAAALIETIARFLERLRAARQDLQEGRLLAAANTAKDFKERMLVDESSGTEDGNSREPLLYALLRNEWMQFFDEFQEVLAKLVEKAVEVDPVHATVRVYPVLLGSLTKMSGDIEFVKVLEALDVAGVLDYGLAKLADLMVKHVMNPIIISQGSVHVSVEEETFSDTEGSKHVSGVLMLSQSQGPEESINGVIYSELIHSIKFIQEFISHNNSKWMRCFGRLTWSRISELVITHYLSKAVPDDASKMTDFDNMLNSTSEFEAFLKEVMFISDTDGSDEKLTTFAHNVEVHFASKKRCEILAKARQVIMECDFDAGMEDFVDLIFQQERCIVSRAALKLMELVHQTLKNACVSSAKVAMEFYRASRDALLLYKATVPVKLEKQLQSIGQTAILVHNDCLYLSHEIAALAFEYRTDFPDAVKSLAVFIDMAPYFRLLAEEIMQKQIQISIDGLNEAIDVANGYQNTHEMPKFELAKFSIDQVVFLLGKVHIIWKPLLSKLRYRKSMCELLGFVFSRILNDILLLDDIAAAETLQLQRLIQMILENISTLIDHVCADDNKESPSNLLLHSDDLNLPSLRKLRKLADLLDMPLKSITVEWESGELIKSGFSRVEMENFIKAIFTDTPLRKDCLWRIASSGA